MLFLYYLHKHICYSSMVNGFGNLPDILQMNCWVSLYSAFDQENITDWGENYQSSTASVQIKWKLL